MVRELLQPLNGGESDPTELGTEILLQSLNPTVEPSNRHGISLSTLLFTVLGRGVKGVVNG
jgi:hypothetical protein